MIGSSWRLDWMIEVRYRVSFNGDWVGIDSIRWRNELEFKLQARGSSNCLRPACALFRCCVAAVRIRNFSRGQTSRPHVTRKHHRNSQYSARESTHTPGDNISSSTNISINIAQLCLCRHSSAIYDAVVARNCVGGAVGAVLPSSNRLLLVVTPPPPTLHRISVSHPHLSSLRHSQVFWSCKRSRRLSWSASWCQENWRYAYTPKHH